MNLITKPPIQKTPFNFQINLVGEKLIKFKQQWDIIGERSIIEILILLDLI